MADDDDLTPDGEPDIPESVHVRTVPMGDDMVHMLDLEAAASRAGVLVLPDRVVDHDGQQVAAFRPEAQPLRVDLGASGVTVELVVPDGMPRRTTEEHAADLILPIVLLIGTIPAGTASVLLADWIRRRRVERPEASRLRYREATRLQDGTLQVIEIEGPPDAVAGIVERRQCGLPPGE